MVEKPTALEIHQLHSFLAGCERAAVSPPPRVPLAANVGLFGSLIAPLHPTDSVLGRAAYDFSLADVMGHTPFPFATEELSGDRAERISKLNSWLELFPAYIWMALQPTIKGGLEAFQRVCKRRMSQPKFTDDLAIFRY